MNTSGLYRRKATARDFLLFREPSLWTFHPFLPVTRRVGDSEDTECGVLYDAVGVSGTYGYSSTVFEANIFDLPSTSAELFRRSRYVYDSFDELADDGWVVD